MTKFLIGVIALAIFAILPILFSVPWFLFFTIPLGMLVLLIWAMWNTD